MSATTTAFADPPDLQDPPIYDYTPVSEPRPRRAPNAAPINISALDFNPPEKVTALILADLTDPDSSLGDIARRANTTVESLTLWMTRPDITARISALHQGIVTKTQLTLASRAAAISSACSHIVNQFNYFESHGSPDSAAARDVTLSIRNRQTAVAAGKLYLRLHSAVARASCPCSSPAPSTSSSPSAAPSSPARNSGRHTLSPARKCRENASDSTKPAERATHAPHPTTDNNTSPSESPDDLLALRAARFPEPESNGTAHKYPRDPKPANSETPTTNHSNHHTESTPTNTSSPTTLASSSSLKFELSDLKSPTTPTLTHSPRAPPPSPRA